VVTSLTTTIDELLHTSDDVGALNTGVAGQNIVALAPGVPTTGGELLTTVIVCATVTLWLPQASTALQVIVRVNAPPQVDVVVISLTTITDEVLQASLAVGAVNVGVAGQITVALAPGVPITGGVLSKTVIVCDTVLLVLPQPSTAFHVIVSAYVPAQLPCVVTSLTCCTLAVLQTSDAVGGVKLGVAGQATVPFAPGAPIFGGVLSTTAIVCATVEL